MLFNSFGYFFCFLPLTAFCYFFFNSLGFYRTAAAVLALASVIFYAIGGWEFVPILMLSIIANYGIGTGLAICAPTEKNFRKAMLTGGILFNLGLLAYFKYANFFIENLDQLLGTQSTIARITLPLALSFVTFQKIAYLVDSYRGLTRGYGALNYGLFVTFFPQLIAGPIVHHAELVPQFKDKARRQFNIDNLCLGLMIFSAGLFKKVVLADTFAQWATPAFDQAEKLTFVQAWIGALSYTYQLYFDFSGYVDMAIGSALIFNINLPINFNSPYRAVSVQDFWRRWHMTLSRFLRDYLYIPLGGNRHGEIRTYINLFLTFLLGGLWHGASWMFIVWGALHGIALIVHRIWTRSGFRLPVVLAWSVTALFIVVTWVFFRAQDMSAAMKMLSAMVAFSDGSLEALVETSVRLRDFLSMESQVYALSWILGAWAIVIFLPTSVSLFRNRERNPIPALYAGSLFAVSCFYLMSLQASPSEFLYFNF